MRDKKAGLVAIIAILIVLSFGSVLAFNIVSNSQKSKEKSPYQLYCESHPDYTGNEEQWLQDLIDGKLGDKEKYTVTFNSNGGSPVDSQTVLEGEKLFQPDNPTKLGYTFDKWVYNGEPWVFYGYSVTQNITLDATWILNTYSIEYNLSGGVIDSELNPTSYDVHSDFTLYSPEKNGYIFGGWINQFNNKIDSIIPGMIGDLFLTADWSPKLNNLMIDVFEEHYGRGTASIINGDGYTNEEIIITANPNAPYAFKGWYNGENELISKDETYIFTMPSNDYSLYAQFDQERYLSLSVDETKGIVTESSNRVIGEIVTVECTIIDESAVFKGWYAGDELVSNSLVYTFEMPSSDYSLVAEFMNDAEIDQYIWDLSHGVIPSYNKITNTISYGMYPQKVVSDTELITLLNESAAMDATGYYVIELDGELEYFTKLIATPADLGNGLDGKKSKIYFDDGNEVIAGNEYWFGVNPVEWNILDDEDGKIFLATKSLLDISNYHSSYETRIIEEETIYANNYKYSDIREWLTTDFYNSLFSFGDSAVLSTEVDNSPESTNDDHNSYACPNTNDKIFLPSYADYLNTKYGFSINESCDVDRVIKTTDYARAKGAWVSNKESSKDCGYSWLRTPGSEHYYDAWRLSYGGGLNHHNDIVECASTCVRPFITISKDGSNI